MEEQTSKQRSEINYKQSEQDQYKSLNNKKAKKKQ